MTCLIPLSQGRFATVDEADLKSLSEYNWRAQCSNGHWYAVRSACIQGHWRTQTMHRTIMGDGPYDIDHRDGDGLNNTRANLRICTTSQNLANSKKWYRGTSKYKGVSWHKVNRKWRAVIVVHSKQIALGCFADETEAARAYDVAALQYFGEFARTNFTAEATA